MYPMMMPHQRPPPAGPTPARLPVGSPRDPAEQEAERVADVVMRAPAPSGAVDADTPSPLPTSERTADGVVPGAGEPLPASARAYFEPRFGHDFSRIRVHSGPDAAARAESVHARAFAVGPEIVFGRGELAPDTADGRRLLAHELAHVVQSAAAPSAPAVLRRQPATGSPPRMSLGELWSAVAATSIGKGFLGQLKEAGQEPPGVQWGSSGFRGHWMPIDPDNPQNPQNNKIVLNPEYNVGEDGTCPKGGGECLNDNGWKQVIAMELGNAANAAEFARIRSDAKSGRLGKKPSAFIRAMEQVEFTTRLKVIEAFRGGEFCDTAGPGCTSIFDVAVTDFEEYMNSSRGKKHQRRYKQEWVEMGEFGEEK